jgi:hypothetical protein
LATKLKKASIALREKSKKDYSPKWDGCESWTADQFMRHFRVALEYYRMEGDSKSYKPAVLKWMADNSYPAESIKSVKKAKDWRVSTTMGAIAHCLNRGMTPVRADFNDGKSTAVWLGKAISELIEASLYDVEVVVDGSVVVVEKPQGPTIQERLRDVAVGMTEELEDAYTSFQEDPDSFNPKAFKVLNLLKGKQAKAAHARIIKDFYAKDIAEIEEAIIGKDDQLKEAYSHRTKAQLKKLLAFLQEIDGACTMLMQEAKINKKPRAKKSVPAEKVVAKLKYAKSYEALKLVSINPADIIGAKELWIFNTKTRKLGKYVAEEYKELSVKGTSITGFSEMQSVQKTLRKPEEQLKEFKAAGKVALRKFLEDIKAVDIKLNGRINEDTVLLKIQ